MRRVLRIGPVWLVFATASALAHDIPNARVDRSIQATVAPGRLTIDYEVGLSELTLTQELRALIGPLAEADRQEWFERYGRETGPLNAKGFLVAVDGKPLVVRALGFDLVVEEHPRYTFHLLAALPARGRLTIHDTNFASSEGTSRLAIRGVTGVALVGDDQPTEVALIPIRPLYELTDAEERRTKQADVEFTTEAVSLPSVRTMVPVRPVAPSPRTDRLSKLLDRASGLPLAGLALVAFALGAVHAFQPGHGKTLVAATVVGERGSGLRGVLVGLVATVTHTGSVLVVAAGLWWSRTERYGAIHAGLARAAGFTIAAIGLWRLGRHLGGHAEHEEGNEVVAARKTSVIGLGVAAGVVPCWDAVALIVLAEAVGRLALGVALLFAFGLGMALVLVSVGLAAARLRRRVAPESSWERRLGIAGSLVLSALGVYLLVV